MSFYNKPWAPNYALPSYLKAEDPLAKGSAVTGSYIPRGTISKVPPSKNGGYVVPQYVLDEPVGSQAHTGKYLPRGTVSAVPASVKSGLPWDNDTLSSNGLGSLGNDTLSSPTLASGDPIREYGEKAATLILQELTKFAPSQRPNEMRKILKQVDPKLSGLLAKELRRAKKAKNPNAMQSALASAFSEGIVLEFIHLGRTKRAKSGGQLAGLNGYNDLSGLGDIWGKLKGLACDVATNPLTPLAAGAAGAYAGGPQGAGLGMSGAGMAAGACSSDSSGGGVYQPPVRQGMPGWAIPAMIGGGALVLFVALK